MNSEIDRIHAHIATCELIAEAAASFLERNFDWLPESEEAEAIRIIAALQKIANGVAS